MCIKGHWTSAVAPALYIFLVVMMVFLAAAFASHEKSNENVSDADEGDDGAWRSADTLHPIQAEMQPYVQEMIRHAFDSYIKYAFPKDELSALSGSGKDTMGGYGWTLIDALDTLAVAGLHTEFRRYARWVDEKVSFDIDVFVSVFETTIRTIGGLLAAHFMYEEGVVEIVASEHDYKGGFVRLAADLGDRILPCFNTSTGIPFGAVNLRHGVSPTETTISTPADGGTFLLEMIALSRVTGDRKYERAARRASEALFAARSSRTGLMGNHINIDTGRWFLFETHVSGGIDSAIEYFIKSHSMCGDIGDWERFERTVRSLNHYLRKGGMLLTANMDNGQLLSFTHESLSSFFPGNLVLGGHHTEATESSWPIHTIFRHFGALPETFSLDYGIPFRAQNYPQRPEHVESVYMLYRATRDPAYLVMGRELALSINLRLRTQYGFARLNNVNFPHHDGRYEDAMESFMLAETLKYLYLLFDECNVVHLQGRTRGSVPSYCPAVGVEGGSLGSHVGWVFNTEAHLFPNTAEWWASGSADSTREQKNFSGGALQKHRLEVIDGLIGSLDTMQGDGGFGKEAGAVPHQYYCANHALSDMERLSKSMFR